MILLTYISQQTPLCVKSYSLINNDHIETVKTTAGSKNGNKINCKLHNNYFKNGRIQCFAVTCSIWLLNTYLDKGTCPKTLRYNVLANITSDQEFKDDIGSIRKKAEKALLGAFG